MTTKLSKLIQLVDEFDNFGKLDRDIALHLAEATTYKSGVVELRYEVRGKPG